MALPAIIGALARVAGSSAAGEMAGAAGGGRAVAMLGQAQGAMNQLGQTAQRSSGMVGQLAGAITGKMNKALTMWIGWVEHAAAPIMDLVRVFNPARAEAFSRAVMDAYGVAGRLLAPLGDAFTRLARKVGNAMAGLEPVFRPAIDAIANLVDVVGSEFGRIIKEQAPVLELMAAAITKVAEAASVAARILGEAVSRFNSISRFVARQFGFTGASFDDKASAVGASARQARFVQPKQISDDAIRNSLMQSLGQKTPEQHQKKTADTLGDIWKWIQQNAGGLMGKGVVGAGVGGGKGGVTSAGLADLSPQVRLMRWMLSQRR